jgi:periplasmic copper chaperone A
MRFSFLAAACVAATAAFSVPTSAVAADNGVTVPKAWARASPGAATTGAAYVTLMGGNEADSLVSVSTPAAGLAEVHESTNDHGVMKMRPVSGVPVPAHKTVTFAPGGYHIMLMALKHPLKAGESFPLTLQFAHAAPVTVDVKVEAMGGHSGHEGMKM